jgi:hypothetical protein
MLHKVPDSKYRRRLLRVVVLQRRLMNALCSLPPTTIVNFAWLQGTWPSISTEWVRRFLENDTGKRHLWINTIASAGANDKQTIRALLEEQLRFAELYHNQPTVTLTVHDWEPPVFAAVHSLLKSFYDPYFYKKEGFEIPGGEKFHKDKFIEGFSPKVKICPYTDNYFQDTKLDHFLPKDSFPMLSCHPDNLVPCNTDSNSFEHKGKIPPIDPFEPEQAANWFHPRWRPASSVENGAFQATYRLAFAPGATPQPEVEFVAINAQDQPRLDNMAKMFGLSNFWGKYLDDEVQSVAGDVQGWLQEDCKEPSEVNVRDYVLRCARQEKKRIGRDGLAIVKSFFYEHIAYTPVLLSQVVRTCEQGT